MYKYIISPTISIDLKAEGLLTLSCDTTISVYDVRFFTAPSPGGIKADSNMDLPVHSCNDILMIILILNKI